MRLVVDTNVILSALLRNSTTRRMLLDPSFELYVPEHLCSELRAHKTEIAKRSALTEGDVSTALDMLLEGIIVVPERRFRSFIPKALEAMRGIDKDDAPFLALALSFPNDGIWSNDMHFQRQNLVKVRRTEDVLGLKKKKRIA